MVPGRVLVSMEDELANQAAALWRSAPLLRKPLAEEAELVLTQNLCVIEDMDTTAVPATTNAVTHINPPEKAQQLGPDACRKCLRGICQGLQNPSGQRTVLLLIDLSMHTCDFARAAVLESFSGQMQLPFYYLGFGTEDLKTEWAKDFMVDFVSTGFLRGEFSLPAAASLPPAAIPAEKVEAAPPQPQLLLMTWCQKAKYEGLPSIRTPDSVLKKWFDHQHFSGEFKKFLAEKRELYPLDLPLQSGSANKRGAEGDGEESAAKRGRSSGSGTGAGAAQAQAAQVVPETDSTMDLSDLPSPVTWEAQVPAAKKGAPTCNVVITIGHRVFLVNRGEQAVVLEEGTALAGWYKGKFAKKPDAQLEGQDVPYKLTDADSLVLMNGKPVTVASLVAEKRQTTPDCVIGYHRMTDQPQPGKPAHFILQRNVDLCYRGDDVPAKREEGEVKIPMHHLGGVIEWHRWDTKCSHILFAVKWNATVAKGLQPLRPVVVTKGVIKISPGRCLELTSTARA